MTEHPSRNAGFLYRRGGNLLFFGLQAVIVLGIVLVVVNISDDKPRLPKSHDAGFGDEVLLSTTLSDARARRSTKSGSIRCSKKATRLH
jgi:hypothetical protein